MTQPPCTILIAGGGRGTYTGIQRALARERPAAYSYTHAATAADALAICRTTPPDALLLCDPIPGASALNLLAELHGANRQLDCAVVVLLAADDPAAIAQARELGAHDYVIRGRGFGRVLGRALSSALAQAELRRQNQTLRRDLTANHQHQARPDTDPDPQLWFTQAAFDALPAHIAVLDRDGTIVAVNAAWRRFAHENGRTTNATLSDLDVGTSYLAACQASAAAGDLDAATAYEGIHGVLAGRHASFTIEYPCHNLREEQWFSMNVAPISASRGGAVVAHTRITRRMQAEQARARSERTLQLFVEHAPAAIALLDRNMIYLAVSRRFRDDYRLGDQPILGRSHYAVFPDIPERWRAIHQRCLAGASASGADDAFPRSDGTLDWLRWSIHPWHDDSGAVGGLILFSEVITRRMQAEQALEQSEAQLAAIIEAAMDAIITVDDEQRIVGWNAAATRMFGCAAAEALGQPIERFVPQRTHAAHGAHVREFGASGGVARAMAPHGPATARRADGSEFLIEASISRVLVGGQTLLTAILRDITARVQAAAQLEAQAAQLGRLHAAAVDLARLIDGPQVSAAMLEHAMAAVGAQHGAVLRYQPDTPQLQPLAARGFSADDQTLLAALPISSETAFTEAIRTQRPVFVERPSERDERYPQLARKHPSAGSPAAAFPLLADGRLIGCIGLIFDNPRHLSEEERALLDTLAQQCAQALDRALLSDAIQAATRAKDEALALLDMLFTSAPAGLAFLDRDLRYIRVNAALAAMNGHPVAEHTGRTVEQVLPQFAPQLVPLYQAVLASGRPVVNREVSSPAGRPAGEQRHWLDSYYPVAAPGAPPIGVGVIVNDVTNLRHASAALHDAERKLATLISILPIGISIINDHGQITFTNPALEQIVELSHEQLLAGEHANHRYINRDGTPMQSAAYASVRAAAEQRLVQNVETGRINDDGSVTWMDVSAMPVSFADWRMVLTVTDITERVAAEQARQQSEERFAKAFYANPAAMIITRLSDSLIIDANTSFQRILGYAPAELIGHRGPDLGIHNNPDERAMVVEHLRRDGSVRNYEATLRTKAGELRHGLFSLELIDVHGTSCILTTFYDITERRRAEQALRSSQQRLAELSSRLVHTQENERRTLAYELHDEIGQQLTGLNLILESGTHASTAQLRAKLREAQQLVNTLTSQVRQLSLDLRPPMIDDLGLLPTLQWQIQRYAQQTGVVVDFKHSGLDAALPPHIAISTYRIVQEALTNVARHAGTSAAVVRVWISAGQLNLTVEDQGRGFDVAAWLPGRTVGLAGMRERAELLGGQLSLDSTPGEGTRIRANLPINAIVDG